LSRRIRLIRRSIRLPNRPVEHEREHVPNASLDQVVGLAIGAALGDFQPKHAPTGHVGFAQMTEEVVTSWRVVWGQAREQPVQLGV